MTLSLLVLLYTSVATAAVPVLKIPAVQVNRALQEDRVREQRRMPPRYAIPFAVAATTGSHGTWEQLENGFRSWRLRVEAPGAQSVNLGFTQFFMPRGGRMIIASADGKNVLRAFTEQDNERHGQLWTPPVQGSAVDILVRVPAAAANQLRLRLGQVGSGYRGFSESRRADSGSCNVDVVCNEGTQWRDQIRSVAVISTGGSTFCTGFLVNNTSRDRRMFFMTAAHCGINAQNAPSLVAIWNYQNSSCRPVGSTVSGSGGDGKQDQFNTGAVFKASSERSDFTLVELDDPADPAHKVFWAGWDATGVEARSATAIHHPSTDEKRISFEFQPTSTTSYSSDEVPGDGTHVRITDWDLGTTEGGSSGSPLFDQNKRIIGQLHGGGAACGNDESDWYGRLSVSWLGEGTPETSLKPHLDSRNTGVRVLDGI